MSGHSVATANPANVWSGGRSPFNVSYGKLMMWFFLLSDAFTFSGLLITYGVHRFSAAGDTSLPLPFPDMFNDVHPYLQF
eukprot:gene18988-25896_t